MVSFNLGPMPGTTMAHAADVVASENTIRTIPLLPARGLSASMEATTIAFMPELPVERGPRSWRMTTRPQLLTRRMWDQNSRDLDLLEELWQNSATIAVSVMGPWSIAALTELAGGHWVVTDPGALRDLTDIYTHSMREYVNELHRRFDCDIEFIINEPELNTLRAGKLKGTSDFDVIPAIHAKALGERLHPVIASLMEHPHITMVRLAQLGENPRIDVAQIAEAPSLLLSLDAIKGNQLLDELGETIVRGTRIGLGCVAPGDHLDEEKTIPRDKAIRVAKLFDELAISRDHMSAVDIHPASFRPADTLVDHGAMLACARETQAMIDRDAGDL